MGRRKNYQIDRIENFIHVLAENLHAEGRIVERVVETKDDSGG